MKVYFNRRVRREAWGGGAHWHSAMVDFLAERGHEVVSDLRDDLDLIVVLDPRHEEGGCDWRTLTSFKASHPNVKLLHRVNECDARNGAANDIDRQLKEANAIADSTVFISEWLRGYFFERGLRPLNSSVVYNGCDLSVFKPSLELKPHSPVRLVTHHWSNNIGKGFDLYHALDKFVEKSERKYEFTYVGRYNSSYTPKHTRVVAPLYGNALGDEIARHDVYVTASRNEPCGLHHLEGAACGLPVLYHEEGGGIVERASKHGLSFRDATTFVARLEELMADYPRFCSRIDRDELSIERCCERYYATMREMTNR